MEASRQVLDQRWSSEISHSDGLQGLYLAAENLVICPVFAIGILTKTHTHKLQTGLRILLALQLTCTLYNLIISHLYNYSQMSISWQSVGEITITGYWSDRVSSMFLLLMGIRFHGVFYFLFLANLGTM